MMTKLQCVTCYSAVFFSVPRPNSVMIIQTNVQQLVSEKFGYKCKTELETTDHD